MTVARRIPLSIPELGQPDLENVARALETGWVSSSGPDIREFELAVAVAAGARYAVATASGTAAIHLALVVAGVVAGDAVIVPPLTFIGTVNPIRYCGATPVFVDVDRADGTLSAEALAGYLRDGTERRGERLVDRASGARLRAVLPVHLYGAVADMRRILEIAAPHGLMVIEDASEALGSAFGGQGAGAVGLLGCLSFNGNKIITTGGGGMVLTADAALAERVRYLSTQARDDPREYVHHEIGYNYRLTNLQAALGLGQIGTLQARLERRRAFARQYRESLAELPFRFLEPRAGSRSNYWLTAIVLDDPARRDALISALDRDGIEARPFFRPLHRQRPYLQAPRAGTLAVADELYAGGVNLPSSGGLSDDDIATVAAAVRRALGG